MNVCPNLDSRLPTTSQPDSAGNRPVFRKQVAIGSGPNHGIAIRFYEVDKKTEVPPRADPKYIEFSHH